MESSEWTSLEIVKLVISTLTPIAVLFVGYYVARATTRLESVQWANQTVIQRRLEIFSEVAPRLNRLLCFALFVGGWKETTPQDAIRLKREADETMFVNRVLFSPELLDDYLAFTNTLFAPFARIGGNAPLRVPIEATRGDRRRLPWWEDSMVEDFLTTDVATRESVQAAYDALSESFRKDLYVTREEMQLPGR